MADPRNITTLFPNPADAGNSIHRHGFTISTRKLPILKAAPIEEMTSKLGITPPEMIFGDNAVTIEHEATGWALTFNAFDALDRVDKTGQAMLKVAYSREWQKNREKVHEGIKEVVKPFDWSYTTDYKGTLRPTSPSLEPTQQSLPLELLRQPDPILFFDEVMLYEDELADNGIAMLSCKIRVMPARMLLLCRFFLRLDDVLFRLRDTRVYVDFVTGRVLREYLAREESFDVVKKKLAITREDVPALMRDANKLSELMPVVDKTVEAAITHLRLPLSTRRHLSLSSSRGFADVDKRTARTSADVAPPPAKVPMWKESDSMTARSPTTETTQRLARELRKRAGRTTETYVAYGVTERMYRECARQADYSMPAVEKGQERSGGTVPKTDAGVEVGVGESWWYRDLGLSPTFNTWAQITMLHLYLLATRFRCFPRAQAPAWQQHLLDHFFYDAEERMVTKHGLHSSGTRTGYLKDLYVQYRGALAAYDEGLCKGDAVLASAVWRNVFGGDDLVDVNGLAAVVAYLRREIARLAVLTDETVAGGDISFQDPRGEESLVRLKSRMMDLPFSDADLASPTAEEKV
ncbi:MAG: hypothetical protein M1838_002810 [Thelocarpon superellum]|nr:MAG: hypothetical protein M1838_002810 [Thelocarpon superellum]